MKKIKWAMTAIWNSSRRPYLITNIVSGAAIMTIGITMSGPAGFGIWYAMFYGFCSGFFFGRVCYGIIEIFIERQRENHFEQWMRSTLATQFQQMLEEGGMTGAVSFGPTVIIGGPSSPDAKKMN